MINRVKKYNLGFTLGSNGLTGIGIVTFEDDTCEAIKVNNGIHQFSIGGVGFKNITEVYDFISGKSPDELYEEIEV